MDANRGYGSPDHLMFEMPGLSGMDLEDRLLSAGHEMPNSIVIAFLDAKLEKRALRGGAIA